ncbi:hypothetical protein EDD21DRAFT_107777 [Dissophora ornata]|nr:hypothetical protein EDD21DRAFT_107777 [Dissophora ornata]
MDVKPLKAIFESFAERVALPTAPVENMATSGIPNPDRGDSPPSEGQNMLQRTRTMEDSLRDLTLHTNFEWNPEDDAAAEVGPKVKAGDLVEILDGLFWLIEKITKGRDVDESHGPPSAGAALNHSSSFSHRLRATSMVDHIVLYSRSATLNHTPVDLASESIDFSMFSKYVSRNTPNLFEVLSQYFYSLFLIGNLLKPADSGFKENMVLPGISAVPVLGSPSTILTSEDLAVVSWFLPLQKATPTLTKLYTGSENGFSMNQFEVHVCKYPAPSLLLLLVEQQLAGTPTINRRQSISFGSASSRHRHSISSNSPPYSAYRTMDGRRSSFEKQAGRSPITTTPTGSALSTIFDGEPMITDEPAETQSSLPIHQRGSTDVTSVPVGLRKNERQRMVLGAYVTETWKVSKAGWGNDLFAIFELSPCFEVFPAKKSSPRQSSSNGPSASSRPIPGRAGARDPFSAAPVAATASSQNRHYIHFLKNAGVGFGGQESESCLLYVDDNLRFGSYRQDFAGGNVYMSAGGNRQSGFEIDFEVVECEVWGLGEPEAKARQKKEWDFEQREANRRASIHLRGKDGEQDIDRDLLVSERTSQLCCCCCCGL